jgi:hypothetical protein
MESCRKSKRRAPVRTLAIRYALQQLEIKSDLLAQVIEKYGPLGGIRTPTQIRSPLRSVPSRNQKEEALGFEVLASSPETALQELRAYSTKWAPLVKERNIGIE